MCPLYMLDVTLLRSVLSVKFFFSVIDFIEGQATRIKGDTPTIFELRLRRPFSCYHCDLLN
uniref:Uncharacterized protein n=1 Tax=Anguilla anguilla TaxID=7936 RepID=A0A0E9XJI2_ANGAN